LIFSKDCFLYDTCKKHKVGNCNPQDNQFCIKLFKLDYLYNESLLTPTQREYVALRIDADGTDREAFVYLKGIENDIENFVKNGGSLYLFSNTCGNGKTAWSIRLLQAYLNSIWHKCDLSCKVLFINVPRFLLSLKDNISSKNDYVEHIKANVMNADIVVWDEVATKSVTQFEHEHLLSLINGRIESGKSQIFTSNVHPDNLREIVGDRLHSRVVNLSTVIEFKGADKRGLK
jgi:DNA replication protein DnaC